MRATVKTWRSVTAIAGATLADVSRQPAHGLVILGTLFAYTLSPAIAMFSFGEDLSLLKDFGVSTLFLSAAVLVAAGVSRTVGNELESRTAHTLCARPVPRWGVLLGKLLGVMGAALWASYLYAIALCLAARIRPPAHAQEPIDGPAVTAAVGAFAVAAIHGAYRSWQSPSELGRASVRAAVVSFTAALALPAAFAADWSFQPSLAWIDPVVLKGCLLGYLGTAPLAAVALLLAVVFWRAALAGTLAAFVLGLAFGRQTGLGLVLPDLQLFWVGEVFSQGAGELSWSYVLVAAAYSLSYTAAVSSLAAWAFERAEL